MEGIKKLGKESGYSNWNQLRRDTFLCNFP